MFRNQVVIAVRNLIRNKGYTFINIAGLAVGIACCVLIMLYVLDELSYDRHYEKADRIYRVGTRGIIGPNEFHGSLSPSPMAETFMREFPEIESAVRIRNFGFPVIRYKDKVFSEERFVSADSTFFEIFTMPFLSGDPKTALSKPNSVVITKSTADKYFGKEDPLGKMINSDNRRDFMITGVIDDFPENSHFHFDFILSMISNRQALDNFWISSNFHTYVLFRDGYNVSEFEAKIPDIVTKYAAPQIEQATGIPYERMLQSGDLYTWFLQPITEIHLYSNLEHEIEINGNAVYVWIFLIVALAVLVIACINFMNLATARSANRAREVGMRKTLGSSRFQLVRQFLTESIFLTSIAVITALILIEFVMPFYNNLIGKNLALTYTGNFITIPALAAFTLLVGVFAGSYPAFFLASFQPVQVLKGKIKRMTKGRTLTRSGLVIFQFAVSIALIAGTFIVFNQLKFLQDKKLGFNKEQIIIVEKTDDIGSQIEAFKNELRDIPSVMHVSNSTNFPGQNMGSNVYAPAGKVQNQNQLVWNMFADNGFASTYQISLQEGRFYSKEFLSDSSAVVLNSAALSILGIKDPIGKEVIRVGPTPEQSNKLKIIGIMEDFHFESLHHKIRPLIILPFGRNGFGRYMSIKVSPENISETLDAVKKTWNKFAGNQAFEYVFFDQEFAKLYESEQRTANIMSIFSVLAIVIACLGLFGLASFTAEQRTKEIGVRKVLGASITNIILMLSKDIVKLVLFANIIALPIVFFVMQSWLENFAYRMPVDYIIFAGTAVIAFVIAILTVSYQAYRAAAANPQESLRYE